VADDPERLIAEALRAQAARTPLPEGEATQTNAAPGLGLAGSGYGLLSGTGLVPPAPIPAETERVGGGQATRRLEPDRGVPLPAILLLAAVLGLAAGAVAGLLTLL
jgi:hypothetical protein